MDKSNFFLNLLNSAVFKTALVKLAVRSGGFRGWLISFIVGELYDVIASPLIDEMIYKNKLRYDKKQGKILAQRLEDAQNEDDYNDTIDDIFK